MLHLLSFVSSNISISNLLFFQLFNIFHCCLLLFATQTCRLFSAWVPSLAGIVHMQLQLQLQLQLFSAHSLGSATLAWLRFGSGRVRVSKFFGCVYCVHYGCVCVCVGWKSNRLTTGLAVLATPTPSAVPLPLPLFSCFFSWPQKIIVGVIWARMKSHYRHSFQSSANL